MSYDLAVIPAESVDSLDTAMRLHAAMCDEVQLPALPGIDEFVEELTRLHGFDSDDAGFLSIDVEADARGVVIATWPGTARMNLFAVLELTMDRGLAVLDVQTLRLYDPRGAIPFTVRLGDESIAPYLSPSLLADLIARPVPRDPFFVVKREEQHYIQALTPARDSPAVVEYRDGSANRHYRAETSDRDLVRDTVWVWASGAARWRTALPWRPVLTDTTDDS